LITRLVVYLFTPNITDRKLMPLAKYVLTIVQHRFILINFLLFSAAVQFCKGR